MSEREELIDELEKAFASVRQTVRYGTSEEIPVEIPARSLAHMALRVFESLQPQWRKFDPNDKSTWPKKEGVYWTFSGRAVKALLWLPTLNVWKGLRDDIVAWQPIQTPEPPKDI